MKRVKTVKQLDVCQSLLLASLVLAGAGAQAAVLPKITVTGVIGNSVITEAVSLSYDPSPWFGKTYTLEMTVDAEGVVGTLETEPGVPGLVFNHWVPNRVDYRLTIDSVLAFSGSDNLYAELETVNNFTVPAGLTDLPPGIQVGHTYDSYLVYAAGAGLDLGCVDGTCDSADDVHNVMSVGFEYFWDMADGDAITNNNLPNLLSGAPYFTQGFGGMYLELDQWSQATGLVEGGLLDSSLTSVTVTPVPEAETYAMMLAGLSLVGWAVRRRRAIPK